MRPTNPLIVVAVMLSIVAAVGAAVYLLPAAKVDAPRKTASGTIIPAPDGGILLPIIPIIDGVGRTLDLNEFRGKTVLLNIWAIWCAPCVEKLPHLDRLQQKLAERGGAVVALSIDKGGREEVSEFYRERGIKNLGIYTDPSSLALFNYAHEPWPEKATLPEWFSVMQKAMPPPTSDGKPQTFSIPLPKKSPGSPTSQTAFATPPIPVTLVIDPQGIVRAKILGDIDWDDEKSVDMILKLGSKAS
jgi:thiol-disulfide isomerase/thioredoxin